MFRRCVPLILHVQNFADRKGTSVSFCGRLFFHIAPANRRQVLGILHEYYANFVKRCVLFPCRRHVQFVSVRVSRAHERKPVCDELRRERKFNRCLRGERSSSVESRDGGRGESH